MIRSINKSSRSALRAAVITVCLMILVLTTAALADGTEPVPPIQNPEALPASSCDDLTSAWLTLLAILWSLP